MIVDAGYFLKKRTNFIRFYYNTAIPAFVEVRRCIEDELPPYDDPPWSDDGEPAYLDEWMDTAAAEQVQGLACVSLLSDSLKLYFLTLQERVVRFRFQNERTAFKNGFLAPNLQVLGEILELDWAECPADLGIIEQIILARNRGQHRTDLTSLEVVHDGKTLKKYPAPFFASESELKDWPREEGSLSWFLMPRLKVSKENLFEALEQVEALVDWLDSKIYAP